ncbi:helix-turn-helix domain-containing protein [Vogesella fluminis]
MLLRFLERPNRVLPREQLLGQHDISPFDRSIDVRISRLRRKLEDDSCNPRLIKTVYGAGYLFVSSVVWE